MPQTTIVVDSLDDWKPYAASTEVMDMEAFIAEDLDTSSKRQIINLCSDYSYLSKGYYCSLSAESRGFRVTPSLKTLGLLNRPEGLNVNLPSLSVLNKSAQVKSESIPELESLVVFGYAQAEQFSKLGRMAYEWCNFPLMRMKVRQVNSIKSKQWRIEELQPVSLNSLSDVDEDFFASIMEKNASSIWRQSKLKKESKLSLAILVDPSEELPPSNAKALKKMMTSAQTLGIETEQITEADYTRLGEFDALFIRTTTAVNHYTYAFAIEAKRVGIIVLDDPDSILKCTNKVFLDRLLKKHKVPIPKTKIISRDQYAHIDLDSIEFPTVLKIPDGSFSRGVKKASNKEEYQQKMDELFKGSHLVLQQEYIYTEYDWRIGILNKSPIYACRYHMAKGHWQIMNHDKKVTESGGFKTLPIREVPTAVIKTAIKAASLIGDGLYGVDIKWFKDQAYVIEINDNPNIDYGIEDQLAGDELYRTIMLDFLRRIYQRQNER
jgi:glutathione synthase/RimK-type ligase-like ATP-grasp enzyme